MNHVSFSSQHLTTGLLLAVASLGASSVVRADSLSCNSRIASTGDSRYEVRAICGEPDDASQRVEYRTSGRRVTGPCVRDGAKLRCRETREQVSEVLIEEWIYDFGKNRFIQRVTFEQGRLVKVESGSYGVKPPR